MKIIDEFQTQEKIFYAGGNELENGLTLFQIAEGMQEKFPDFIQKDVYAVGEKAFAFDKLYIVDAKKQHNWNEYERMLVDDIYDFFIKSENGGIRGTPEYKADAKYFVIHEGTHNYD